MSQHLLRQIPAVDKWLASERGSALCAEFSHVEVVDVMRKHLSKLRQALENGADQVPALESEEYFALLRADLLERRRESLRRTINATGIIIHTNLGRAPLAPEALAAIERVAGGYSNLEFDLERSKRGSRYQHVEPLLTQLTGAESAVVVNNCAAAVLLVLNTFCQNGEVVISRGELIEIGGSFRMPDVIARSGARMVEVGTTNKTSIGDYAASLTEETRVLLATHPSNYRIVGFTAKPSLKALAALAHQNDLLLIEDFGSGTLFDLSAAGLPTEPTVAGRIGQGVDLVTFSGDKMLGGPQAGIIVGRGALIDTVKRNPMLRAMRIDKLSLAALAATLRLYLPPNEPLERVPVLRMISEDQASVERRARGLLEQLSNHATITGVIEDDVSYAGGGALPMNEIPTKVIRLQVEGFTAEALAQRLRESDPPVLGRLANDALTLDLRTVQPSEATELVSAIEQAVQ